MQGFRLNFSAGLLQGLICLEDDLASRHIKNGVPDNRSNRECCAYGSAGPLASSGPEAAPVILEAIS